MTLVSEGGAAGINVTPASRLCGIDLPASPRSANPSPPLTAGRRDVSTRKGTASGSRQVRRVNKYLWNRLP